jgi:hypothetical protein
MQDLKTDSKENHLIEEMRQGALAISRAVLYVKQHSINCISAALYAICCFEPKLFTPEMAEAFTIEMFTGKPMEKMQWQKRPANFAIRPCEAPPCTIKAKDADEIQTFIITLFKRFMSEKNNSKNWNEPLMNFLKEMPAKKF